MLVRLADPRADVPFFPSGGAPGPQEEEPDAYRKLFSNYIKNGVEPDEMEELYESVHAAIRENPIREKKARSKPASAPKHFRTPKLTLDERRANLKSKLESLLG